MLKWLGSSLFFLGLLTAVVLLFLPFHKGLWIVSTNGKEVVLCAEMEEGEEFVLSFIHSVNKRPVYDTLRVEGDHLLISKSRYDSFGAGIPETSTETSELKIGNDGWLELTVNRRVPEILLFVGRVANHSLSLKGRQVALADVAKPGTSLSIKVRSASFFEIWKGRCLR